MNLNIENHAEYKIYNRTFLYKVEARFHYKTTAPDFNEKLAVFLTQTFGVDFPLGRIEAMAIIPVRFFQQDEVVQIKVTDDFVEIRFKHEGYTSFGDSLLPLIVQFARFFAETESTIYNISLQKTNLFVYEPDESTTIEVVRQKMFSGKFNAIEQADLEPSKDGEWHQYVHMDDDESGIGLHIFAVLEHIEDDDTHMGVSLQTLTKITRPTEPADLADRYAIMNGILYQAFHWVMNPAIIRQAMDTPDTDDLATDNNE